MLSIRSYTSLATEHISRLFHIWNEVYPTQIQFNTLDEFNIYLASMNEAKHHVAVTDHNEMIGWLVTLNRDDQRWFIVIIDSNHHKQGLGSRLMSIAKAEGVVLNGWVVLDNEYVTESGKPYASPVLFYQKEGFIIDKGSAITKRGLTSYHMKWHPDNS